MSYLHDAIDFLMSHQLVTPSLDSMGHIFGSISWGVLSLVIQEQLVFSA